MGGANQENAKKIESMATMTANTPKLKRLLKDPTLIWKWPNRKMRLWYWNNIIRGRNSETILLSSKHGKMEVSTSDQVIARTLFVHGQYQYDDLREALVLIKNHITLNPNLVGLDIGSNIGPVGLQLVVDGHFKTVLAIEPDPLNYKLLQANIAHNHLDGRLSAMHCALSDEDGEIELELSTTNFGDHRVRVVDTFNIPLTGEEARRQTVVVPKRTLDSILQEHHIQPQDIGFINVDIQGHEWYFLKGAVQTLEQNPVPLRMEIWPYGLNRAHTDIDNFVELLSHFYSNMLCLTDDSGVEPVKELRGVIEELGDSFIDILFF